MAETLLAILLVTSSAKGSSLVYRWPPSPSSSPRLVRPRPHCTNGSQLDNPWRASQDADTSADRSTNSQLLNNLDNHEAYEWQRPNPNRDRSMSFTRSVSHPSSGRNSPSQDDAYDIEYSVKDEYKDFFGYSSEFLAGILCPQMSLCHQKFELIVDDLAFIGHPVCAEADGVWRFKPEKFKPNPRGRNSRSTQLSQVDEDSPVREDSPSAERTPAGKSAWLQTFQLVIVMDLPDPSTSASGNLSKYFDVIYEQICFTVAAVLFQEQVLTNFVETECDVLGSLKDEYISKGAPFSDYMEQALQVSSIAPAMKTLYEAIKTSSMAYVTIHNLPLELQLPPYLDSILHGDEDQDADLADDPEEYGETGAWGREMSFGWRLPILAPWKSLLLLDGHDDHGVNPYLNLRGPHVSPEDRTVAEGLIKFLETASVTLSLADMASLLDWDLESQVFPTVRWLVHHRRAKVVDIVHSGLKTVFTLPPRFEAPLSELSADFERAFTHPQVSVPPLVQILSAISTAPAMQTDFFKAVVRQKDLVPLYHDIVFWMLKRDLLITLHLRIRVLATPSLKLHVRRTEQARRSVRRRKYDDEGEGENGGMRVRRGRARALTFESEKSQYGPGSGVPWLSLSPKSARKHTRQVSSTGSGQSEGSDVSSVGIFEDEETSGIDGEEEESDMDSVEWNGLEDNLWPSLISDPGKATPLERRWLSAMSEGKDPLVARRFEQINQFFDGRKTDDEILFRAEITRKQLREVLHHYEEYLQTFLHPS